MEPAALVAAPKPMSWSAIWGGTFAALGVGALFYAFGLAIGLSGVDPHDPSSLQSSGVFGIVWYLVTAFVALFVGGLVTARGAGVLSRVSAAVHGVVTWGVTTVAASLVLIGVLVQVVNSAVALGNTAIQTGAQTIAAAVNESGGAAQALGLNFEDLLVPINARLRAAGKPAVTADQLEAAVKDVVQRAARQGRIDRELLVGAIAQNTALSRADAQQLATRIADAFNGAVGGVSTGMSDALQWLQVAALRVVSSIGTAFWEVFGGVALGLISALLGSMLGVSRRQRRWARAVSEPPSMAGQQPSPTHS